MRRLCCCDGARQCGEDGRHRFKAVAVAPIPKEPTPLLDPDTVSRMGYLPRSSDQRASPQAITLPALPSPQSPSSHQSLATEGMGYVAFPSSPRASPSHSPQNSPAAHSVHSPKRSSRSPRRSSTEDVGHTATTPVIVEVVQEARQASPSPSAQSVLQPRRSLVQRIRRSVSRIGRRLNCFRSGRR